MILSNLIIKSKTDFMLKKTPRSVQRKEAGLNIELFQKGNTSSSSVSDADQHSR